MKLSKLIILIMLITSTTFAMDKANFKKLVKQLKSASFGSDKITIIKTASDNTFTVKQVVKMMNQFSFASDKLSLLKVVSDKIENPEKKHKIIASFNFSSEKKKARKILSNIKKAKKSQTQKFRKALIVNQLGAYPKGEFKELLRAIKKESFSSDKVKVLKDHITDRSEGFKSKQLIKLIKSFSFGSDMVKMIKLIDNKILGMRSKEMLNLLKTFSFGSDKLKALKLLKDTITDVENKFVILDAFTFGSDKEKARKILETIKPRSLVYGRLNSNRVVFVVDISGSMQARFMTSQSESLTRLTFVKRELEKVLKNQMTSDIKFNIIVFNEKVYSWKMNLVSAKPQNIKEALNFLNNLRADGGTNIYDSLKEAVTTNRVNTVYFLTDGMPTAGLKTDIKSIIHDLKNWSKRVVVNTTAFLIGHHSSDNERKSINLMRSIAQATGGVYRAIDD